MKEGRPNLLLLTGAWTPRKGNNQRSIAGRAEFSGQNKAIIDESGESGMMAHACNPSTWQAEIGLRVGGQPKLHSRALSPNRQRKHKKMYIVELIFKTFLFYVY